MPTPQELEELLLKDLPGADVTVRDTKGSGDHFSVEVVSGRFRGLSRVAQHRLIYECLGSMISDGRIHAISIRTRAPQAGGSEAGVPGGGGSEAGVAGEAGSEDRLPGQGARKDNLRKGK